MKNANDLTKEWKKFMEGERLKVIVETNEQLVDVLYNFEFTTANVLTKTFTIEETNQLEDVDLEGYESIVKYSDGKGDSFHFTLGLYNYWDEQIKTIHQTNWQINVSWNEDSIFSGLSFIQYFESIGALEKLENIQLDWLDVLDMLFDKFNLMEKIEAIHYAYVE